jgi:hypothetical protein
MAEVPTGVASAAMVSRERSISPPKKTHTPQKKRLGVPFDFLLFAQRYPRIGSHTRTKM